MIPILPIWDCSVKRSNYERLILRDLKRSIPLDHSKDPCDENFIPDKRVNKIGLLNYLDLQRCQNSEFSPFF